MRRAQASRTKAATAPAVRARSTSLRRPGAPTRCPTPRATATTVPTGCRPRSLALARPCARLCDLAPAVARPVRACTTLSHLPPPCLRVWWQVLYEGEMCDEVTKDYLLDLYGAQIPDHYQCAPPGMGCAENRCSRPRPRPHCLSLLGRCDCTGCKFCAENDCPCKDEWTYADWDSLDGMSTPPGRCAPRELPTELPPYTLPIPHLPPIRPLSRAHISLLWPRPPPAT